MIRSLLYPPHFHAVQMGRWQPEGLTEGFFPAAFTPPTRLRQATSPFVPAAKMGRTMHARQGAAA
jgi:hypothetical protein